MCQKYKYQIKTPFFILLLSFEIVNKCHYHIRLWYIIRIYGMIVKISNVLTFLRVCVQNKMDLSAMLPCIRLVLVKTCQRQRRTIDEDTTEKKQLLTFILFIYIYLCLKHTKMSIHTEVYYTIFTTIHLFTT